MFAAPIVRLSLERSKTEMAKFRKKPVVIEAVQFRAGEQDSDLAGDAVAGRIRYTYEDTVLIKTLEGERIARSGDWVIRGVKGELWPCRDDIFQATYEKVEE